MSYVRTLWRVSALPPIALFFLFMACTQAAADDRGYDTIVHEVVEYSPGALSNEDTRARVSVTGPSDDDGDNYQKAKAFTLSPQMPPRAGERFSVRPSEEFDPSTWKAIAYLASHLGEIDGRIHVAGGDTPVKENAELSAYQLAIWDITSPGTIKALPEGRVKRRATVLAADARLQAMDSGDPSVGRARLQITSEARYPNGERVRIRLTDTSEVQRGLGGQLVTMLVNGRARNSQVTDDSGTVFVDVPNEPNFIGELSAEWLSRLPPATFLRSGDGQWLVLAQSLPIQVVSDTPVKHSSPGGAELIGIYKILAFRWAGQYLSTGWVYFIGFSIIFGIPTAVSAAVKKAKGLTWFVCMLLAIALCAVAGRVMAKAQAQEFDVSWRLVQDVAARSVLDVESVAGSSKRKSNRYKTAYNWPCVADKNPTTPWVSDGERGPLETVALDFGREVQIEQIEFTMGWPDSKEDYLEVGRPSRVEIIGQSGQVNQVNIDERSWDDWETPVSVDLRDRGRTPVSTQVLYVRTLTIVGGVKTNFGISSIEVVGSEGQTGKAMTSSIDLDTAFRVHVSEGCGFQ